MSPERSALIKLASTLPKGDENRKVLLTAAKAAPALSMKLVKEWNDQCEDMKSELEGALKAHPELKAKIEKAIDAVDEANSCVQDIE